MPLRILWIADDEDEPSYAAAASNGQLAIDWQRLAPGFEEIARYDLLVADPGALRLSPDDFEQRVHAELPSTPIVFYSGLRPEHHARGGVGLRWSIPSLVTWLTHAEAPLVADLPRRLAEIARAAR